MLNDSSCSRPKLGGASLLAAVFVSVVLFLGAGTSVANAVTTLSKVDVGAFGSGDYVLVLNAAEDKKNNIKVRNYYLSPYLVAKFDIVDTGDVVLIAGSMFDKYGREVCVIAGQNTIHCEIPSYSGNMHMKRLSISTMDQDDFVTVERKQTVGEGAELINDKCEMKFSGITWSVSFNIRVDVKAGSGNDYIYGGCGEDNLLGESGDDIVIGSGDGGSKDTLDCGSGSDYYRKDLKDAISNCETKLFSLF